VRCCRTPTPASAPARWPQIVTIGASPNARLTTGSGPDGPGSYPLSALSRSGADGRGHAWFDARRRRVHDRACLVDDGTTGGCQGIPGHHVVVATQQQIDGMHQRVWPSPDLARKLSMRPGRYCIRLSQVFTSAVSWPVPCLVRLAGDFLRLDYTYSAGFSGRSLAPGSSRYQGNGRLIARASTLDSTLSSHPACA
jgi:hypothetical protein